jgi:putative salt-induced outer membrane protein YdiY
MKRAYCCAAFVLAVLAPRIGYADNSSLGAPPPDAAALVSAPKAAAAAPTIEKPTTDRTAAAVSAGAQIASGNARMIAATANGKLDLRRGADGFGASLLANYGESAQPGNNLVTTTQNAQGRVRYDRYFSDDFAAFLIATGRHDRFQGLSFRLNLDPGVKYLFINGSDTAFWAEAGYDFQYDIRIYSAREQHDAAGNLLLDGNGNPLLLDKTATDHSSRVFLGVKHAFTKDASVVTGVEYLQSFVDATRYRVNFDALFAAAVGGGFSVGLGFSARYDHAPLPEKEKLDTATTASLIYAFSSTKDSK